MYTHITYPREMLTLHAHMGCPHGMPTWHAHMACPHGIHIAYPHSLPTYHALTVAKDEWVLSSLLFSLPPLSTSL